MVKAIRTSALVLLLACSAQAGVMQNDAPAPPPPSTVTASTQEPADAPGELSAGGNTQDEAPSDLSQMMLEVLAVLPSLF